MSSRNRLTWRTLRLASDKPFLWASSSSRTVIGRYTSCSSNRKIEVGSCMSTFVSSTKSLRPSRGLVFMSRGWLAAAEFGPGSERLRRFKYFLRVTGDLHLAPLVPQHAFAIQQERAALDTKVLFTVKALLFDDIEELAKLLVWIAQQWKG